MPRNARRWLVVALAGVWGLAGCFFDADYQAGRTTCTDGMCPSGLVCALGQICVAPGQDAGSATHADGAGSAADAHVAALTCADPGQATSGVAESGTTAGRADSVSASCAGSIMNGPDAVYAIALTATQSLELALTGASGLTAYALAACQTVPATPTCTDNMAAAAAGATVTIAPGAAGTYYIVVDSALAAGSGAYALTATAD